MSNPSLHRPPQLPELQVAVPPGRPGRRSSDPRSWPGWCCCGTRCPGTSESRRCSCSRTACQSTSRSRFCGRAGLPIHPGAVGAAGLARGAVAGDRARPAGVQRPAVQPLGQGVVSNAEPSAPAGLPRCCRAAGRPAPAGLHALHLPAAQPFGRRNAGDRCRRSCRCARYSPRRRCRARHARVARPARPVAPVRAGLAVALRARGRGFAQDVGVAPNRRRLARVALPMALHPDAHAIVWVPRPRRTRRLTTLPPMQLRAFGRHRVPGGPRNVAPVRARHHGRRPVRGAGDEVVPHARVARRAAARVRRWRRGGRSPPGHRRRSSSGNRTAPRPPRPRRGAVGTVAPRRVDNPRRRSPLAGRVEPGRRQRRSPPSSSTIAPPPSAGVGLPPPLKPLHPALAMARQRAPATPAR